MNKKTKINTWGGILVGKKPQQISNNVNIDDVIQDSRVFTQSKFPVWTNEARCMADTIMNDISRDRAITESRAYSTAQSAEKR